MPTMSFCSQVVTHVSRRLSWQQVRELVELVAGGRVEEGGLGVQDLEVESQRVQQGALRRQSHVAQLLDQLCAHTDIGLPA